MTFKNFFTLPTLIFLPLIAYLFIYSSNYFLALTLLGLYVYNLFNQEKSIPSFFLISMLLLSFFFYAFHNLGSKETPLTYQTFNYKGDSINFKFKQKEKLDQFCYYFSIDKDAKFDLETKEQTQWKKFFSLNDNFPFSFQWSCKDINITTKELRLTLTEGQMMLNEIRFRNQGRDINFTSDKPKVNDETDIAVSKSYYDGTIFDEIYHPRTAYEIMRNIHPIYENTHPYLGKLLIIPGIKLFGMTPFGWRFTNVLFGALFIVVAYYFSLALFRKKLYAFVGAFLMTYSFMHLTESRVGLIDTFGVLFVFVSYFFIYKFIDKQKLRYMLLSGLFFGLASAVKWSAVFASLGYLAIAIYLLASRYPLKKEFAGYRLIGYGLLSYGLLAVTVYVLSFYEIYLHTHSLSAIWDYQVNMYAYHSHLIATHPYSSPWYTWPFDVKPMCATRNIVGDTFSSVTIFGNPAIFWTGVIALLYLVFVVIKRKSIEAVVILFGFLALYAPYAFIHRLMFLYHYYYAVPFVILAIVYGAKDFLTYYPKHSIILYIYLAVVAGLFLEFYPVLSGYEVPKSYVDNVLTWFPGWWL